MQCIRKCFSNLAAIQVLVWGIAVLEIHSLLYIFLEYTDISCSPSKESFQGDATGLYSHSILSLIFLWTRSKDCPIKREEPGDGISSHDSVVSSCMTLVRPLNHLPESYLLFGTMRGSEYLNPMSLLSSTRVAVHSPNPWLMTSIKLSNHIVPTRLPQVICLGFSQSQNDASRVESWITHRVGSARFSLC